MTEKNSPTKLKFTEKLQSSIECLKKRKVKIIIGVAIFVGISIFGQHEQEAILIGSKIFNFIFKNMDYVIVFFIALYIGNFLDYLSKNGYTKKWGEKKKGRYELITINDALVKELMKLRFDITAMKINQDKFLFKKIDPENRPCDLDYPDEFLKLFRIYKNYPNSAICKTYKTKNGRFGGIIVLLDYDVSDLDDIREYNVEMLRKVHAEKNIRISEGDTVYAHIFDPDIDEKFMLRDRRAKILSIKHREYDYCGCFVKFEIIIDSSDDHDYDVNEEKIIKDIEFYSNTFFKIQ